MELRHIYRIASILNTEFRKDDLVGADSNDMELSIKVSPATLYGIDREFYKMTHGSFDGFMHKDRVEAVIDGIHFVLTSRKNDGE